MDSMSEKIYEEAWKYSMDELHKEYKSQNKEDEFVLWFNMNYVEDTIESITVSVPSAFLQKMVIEKGYLRIVESKLRDVTGQNNIKLNCIVSSEPKTVKEEKPIVQEPVAEIKQEKTVEVVKKEVVKDSPKKKHPLLQEEYCFETFIPGDNSSFAYNAALAVAKNPGKTYNPLLLYGGSGLGKTHLMQAIGNYIYNNGGEKLKISYVSAETFGNDFTSSLTSKKTNEFKNKYRNLDVLLLDDIHFLQGKEGMQSELFYTFEALSQRNAQMVFTCDRPIKEIKNMADRLVSRLANGISIDLQPPNYETRVAIIQKKLQLKGKVFDQEIVDYIAKNVEKNVRELEAALNKIIGYSELIGSKPTIEVVKSQLRDLLTTSSAENITLDAIMKVVADNYQISVEDLKGKKRDKKFAVPRQVAFYIAREIAEYSFMEIGNAFGGRDHTTVMHGYNKIADQIKVDSITEAKIDILKRQIKEYKKM